MRHAPVQIGPNTVVTFHYTLHDANGNTLESSRGGEPSAYLHGAGNILPALEQAMAGKAAGDTFSAELNAEQAYGERIPGREQRVPVKHLSFKGKLRAGMVAQLNTSEGLRAVTVVKAGRHSADIDTNHPLAGQALRFDIDIQAVREATAEERAHGHAHGPGGHHHH